MVERDQFDPPGSVASKESCAQLDTMERHMERLLRHVKAGLDGQDVAASSHHETYERLAVPGAPGYGFMAQVGRFVLLRELGRGGMGVVFAAYDERLDRKVALKLLHPFVSSVKARERMLREAQALARLSHPNVVQVYEVGIHGEQVYLVMEFVRGRTLRQWFEDETTKPVRSRWRSVLEIMVAAGEGLAAAHEAGLTHRDFKPDNVIVGDDGRVRVVDFGLATEGGEEHEESLVHGTKDDSVESRWTVGLDQEPARPLARLTQTGAMVGTVSYMSLEQLCGKVVDARSDQFSFCVTIYEALFGERPFDARTQMGMMVALERGVPRMPEAASDIPRWLRRALWRGLAKEPNLRWPSTAELVEELQHGMSSSKIRGWALGGAVVVAGLLGLAVSQQEAGPAPCPVTSAERGLLWSSARRERIADAFERSGSPLASDTLGHVTPVVDGYLDELGQMRAEACGAHRRGEHSDRLFDLRTACLDVRRAGLDEMLTGLEHADATTVHNAAWAVASLPSVEPCGDTEALTAAIAPPQDAAVAQQVQAHREDLAGVASLVLVGSYEDAHVRAEAVRQDALAIGYAPLVAEAELRLGHALMESYQHEAALEALSRGITEALRSGHDEVAVEALARRMWVLADPLRRPTEAMADDRIASALLDKIGRPAELEWLLLNNRGVALFRGGRRAQAEASYREALATLGEEGERAHPVPHISTRFNLAMLLSAGLDEPAAAATELASLRDRASELLGPEHPRVGIITVRLAANLVASGRYDEARAELDRGVARWSGPDGALLRALMLVERAHLGEQLGRHTDALADARKAQELAEVDAMGTLAASIEANAMIGLGQTDEGVERLHWAIAREIERAGPEHEATANACSWAGYGLQLAGRLDEAAEQLERAREIFAAQGLDAPSYLGREFAVLVEVQLERGALARVETIIEETRRAQDEAGFAEDNAHRHLATKLEGDLLAARGDRGGATRAYAQACQGLLSRLGPENPDVAECRLAQARVLGGSAEGRAYAEQAAEAFARLGEGFTPERETATALAEGTPSGNSLGGE